MTNAVKNVLIVGSGSIGMRHVTSLRALAPSARISFLREGARSGSSPALDPEFGLFSSLEEAIAARPQLIVIANPSSMHLRYMQAAIVAGIPFYAEKPLITSRADLTALRAVVEGATDIPVNMVGCNLRFLPSLLRLRTLLQDQAIGRVVRATFEAGQWLPDWRPQQDYTRSYSAKTELGGGVLLDLIHEVDAARWLLGDFEAVQGVIGKFSDLSIETEDTAALILSRRHGPLTSIQLDYVSRTPVRRYTFTGDRGTIHWDLRRKLLSLTDERGVEESLTTGDEDFSVPGTYFAAMAEMLAAIAAGRPTSQPIEEGMAALELIFTIKEAN
jgi:predicted dehydrogenase